MYNLTLRCVRTPSLGYLKNFTLEKNLEFEEYWLSHEKELILRAPKKLQDDMLEATKLTTVTDWAFFIFPICVGVLIQPFIRLKSEILSWLVSVVAIVIIFVALQILKPYVSKKKTSGEAKEAIKQFYWERYKKYGIEKLAVWEETAN